MTDFESDVFFLDIQPWAEAQNRTFKDKREMIEAYWAEKLVDQGKRPLVAIR